MSLRVLLPLLLAICGGAALADGVKEAKALFEVMETKLNAAKALRITFSCRTGGEYPIDHKATLALRPGNKLSLSLRSTTPHAKPSAKFLTADGTTLQQHHYVGKTRWADEHAAEPELESRVRSQLARLAAVAPLLTDRPGKKREGAIVVDNFRLGSLELAGTRLLQAIGFECQVGSTIYTVTLWIDLTSGLPVRRTVSTASQPDAIGETYIEIDLDPDLPEDTFRLWQLDDAFHVRRSGEAEDGAPKARFRTRPKK